MKDAIRRRIMSWFYLIGKRIIPWAEKRFEKASKVGNATFFEVDKFPWAEHIEGDWHLIENELDEVLGDREHLMNFQDLSVGRDALTTDNNWKTFLLYGYGFRSDANCERCPETARLCSEIPGMKRAFFSILSPHKHIDAHYGPFNGIMRYHLGLRIPEPKESCRIRVGDDVRHWEPGRSMIFDDTHEHEVWNDTEGTRVVLFVDFVRPLRFPWNLVNALVLKAITYTPAYTDTKQRELDWEERLESVKAQAAVAA